MNKIFCICITVTILISACKTEHEATGGKIKEMNAEQLDQKIQENKLVYETFYGKADVKITGPGVDQGATASMYMQKDSFIGVSLRVLSIEGLRVYITPDSIQILDRLNQKYFPRPYSYLRDSMGVSINFSDLQNLIAGNPIVYDNMNLTPASADDKYVLNAENDVYKNTIWLYPSFDIMRMFIRDLQARRNITLDYSSYHKIDGHYTAFVRKILIDAESDYSISLVFSKITINEPLDFSFTVSSKYKKVE